MDGICGTQNRIGLFLSLSEMKQVIVNSRYDYVWEAKDKRTGALIDILDSSDWLCFWVCPMSLTMMNSRNIYK